MESESKGILENLRKEGFSTTRYCGHQRNGWQRSESMQRRSDEPSRIVSIYPFASNMNQFSFSPNSCLNVSPPSFILNLNWQETKYSLNFLKIVQQDRRKYFLVIFTSVKETQRAARLSIKKIHQTSRIQEAFSSIRPLLKLHEINLKILC